MNIDYESCPNPAMIPGLKMYVEQGIAPGSFMRFILESDFIDAWCCIDSLRIQLLIEWASFCVNELPSSCWGSKEIVQNWKGTKNGNTQV